jgi:hypothetical protein
MTGSVPHQDSLKIAGKQLERRRGGLNPGIIERSGSFTLFSE